MIDKSLVDLIGENEKYVNRIIVCKLLGIMADIIFALSSAWMVDLAYSEISAVLYYMLPMLMAIFSIALKVTMVIVINHSSHILETCAKRTIRMAIFDKTLKQGGMAAVNDNQDSLAYIALIGVEQMGYYYSTYLPEVVSLILSPTVLIALACFSLKKLLSMSMIALLLLLASLLVNLIFKLLRIYSFYPALKKVKAVGKRIIEYLDETDAKWGVMLLDGYDIDIKHMSYSYDGVNPLLLDINLTIPAGQRVEIVSSDASARDCLIGLLLGFKAVETGSITIGASKLEELSREDYYKHVYYGKNLEEIGRLSKNKLIYILDLTSSRSQMSVEELYRLTRGKTLIVLSDRNLGWPNLDRVYQIDDGRISMRATERG